MSEETRKTYIEFSHPGAFFSEYTTREVEDRDVWKVVMPDDAFAFRFFDIVATTTDDKVKLVSSRLNVSPTHYYGGQVFSLAELKRDYPESRTLIANITSEENQKAIRCRTGNWQPFEATDIFIQEVNNGNKPKEEKHSSETTT